LDRVHVGRTSNAYILSADVYRRDEVDPTHYPVFHQMEGIRLFSTAELLEMKNTFSREKVLESTRENPIQEHHQVEDASIVANHLKVELEGLIKALFQQDTLKVRWIEAYFPFTSPSWEMEIYYNNQWLEVLGCGVMQQSILNDHGCSDQIGWAFGIGLERIAMVTLQFYHRFYLIFQIFDCFGVQIPGF
jgi:phenylalanyl-tRNA synthetase alpha chain